MLKQSKFRVFMICLSLLVLFQAACSSKQQTLEDSLVKNKPIAEKKGAAPNIPIVREDSHNLLFSYLSAAGKIQSSTSIKDVPEKVKAHVLVIDLGQTPEQRQAHRYAFFADLTSKDKDGNYSVQVVSRYQTSVKANAEVKLKRYIPGNSVIVYSATWCGYCKKAKSWLKSNGIEFVERDVEKEAGAQAELQEKLKNAQMSGGGIPVVDWRGRDLIVGYSTQKMQALWQQDQKHPELFKEDAENESAQKKGKE